MKKKKEKKAKDNNVSKALLDTESIIRELVKNKVEQAENVYLSNKRKEVEMLHNKIVESIQEINAEPSSVIFVLELIKSEVLRQFEKKVV